MRKKVFLLMNLLFVTTLSSSGLIGCTNAKPEESKIALSIPQTIDKALSNSVNAKGTSAKLQAANSSVSLKHLIINVSGEGIISPILFTWDSCRDCDSPPPPPTSFQLNVPMGKDRLIQVLGVYGNPDTDGEMTFYYGDTVKSLVAAEEKASIGISAISTTSTVTSGRIAGRYLLTSNFGPTGLLYAKYIPPGKPGMIIEKSWMMNGWFSIFGLAEIPLNYELANGTLIFEKTSLNSTSFAGNPIDEKIIKAVHPEYFKEETRDGVTSHRYHEPETFILGYFGSAAATAGKYSCKELAIPNDINKVNGDGTVGSTLTIGDFQITAGNGPCSGGSEYVDFIKYKLARISEGKDTLSGLALPFALLPDDSQQDRPLLVSYDNSNITFTVQPLPGLGLAQYSGLKVFKRYMPANDQFNKDNGVSCFEVERGIAGFSLIDSKPLTIQAQQDLGPYSLSSTEAKSTMYAICLSDATNTARGQALIIPGDRIGGGGGPYLRVEVSGGTRPGEWDHYTIQKYQGTPECYPVQLKTFIQNGGFSVPYTNPDSPLSITVNTQPSAFAFYTDASCGTPLITPATININQNDSTSITYYLRGAAPASYQQINLSVAGSTVKWQPEYNKIAVVEGYLKIASGYGHKCGITKANELKCWGFNGSGQLGTGDTTDRTMPTHIDGGTTYIDVAAGHSHTCAITAANDLKCWGSNGFGQVGDATTTDRNSPVTIGSSYSKISIGNSHSCGISVSSFKCWGNNFYGQIGNSTNSNVLSPQLISIGGSPVDISAGWQHTCAIYNGGSNFVKCWGDHLGIGDTTNNDATGASNLDANQYSAISTGQNFSCAIDSGINQLRCLGKNNLGQLGDTTLIDRSSMVPVDTGTAYSQISAFQNHACGITTSGSLKCWGSNTYGQLGYGNTTDSPIPTSLSLHSGLNVSKVSAGGTSTCALDIMGYLYCWGDNSYGQLGGFPPPWQ